MTRNAHGFLLRALLCFSFVAGIALTGCSPTPPNHFKSTWRIPSSDLDIRLPLRVGYDYDFTVSWGDGSSSEVKAHDDPAARHTYEAAGDYTITIVGTLEAWYFNSGGDKDKIIAVENFGRMGWKDLENAFASCENLTTFKGGDVSQVTDMRDMFSGTSSLEQLDTSNWDVSSVTNMSYMFSFASKLKQLDLNNWDVSSVTNMRAMFSNASSLEQLDTSNWDFGKVTTMENIFEGASELTTESYSDMLMRIVDTSNKNSVTLGGGLAKYNDCGAKAKAILTAAPRSWEITDREAQDGGADIGNCEWSPQTTFKSTWRIPSSDPDIKLPLREGYDYDFTVSWGDGSSSEVKAHDDPAARHTYNAAGDYTITIVGTLEAWYFNNDNDGDKDKIIAVENFGRMGWKNLKSAFAGCENLTTFKGGDVSQVTNMGNMFAGTSLLEQLDTSNWDVSSVENMSGMFSSASSLEQLDTSNWDFGKVTTMENIFEGASELTTESYSEMLMRIVDTSRKGSVPLGVHSIKHNDCGAKAKAELESRGWTIADGGEQDGGANADNCEWSPPQNTFKSTWKIPSEDLDIQLPLRPNYNYDFTVSWGDGISSEVKAHDDPDARYTYEAAGDYTITIVGTLEAWYFNSGGDKDKIIAVENFGRMGWKNLKSAFAGCENLTTFKGGDVSQVTDMGHMFAGASSLEELNTSNWNVSSVENMTSMFNNASSLAQLDLNNWDVSSVEDMSGMFRNASSLKQLDLSNWDVSSVEDMSLMFYNASSLEQLDTSNWDFGKVTTMENIFEGASELTTESYSDMLMRIVDTSTSQDITLGEGAAKYNDCGAKARAELLRRGWTVNDAEPEAGADAAKCTASEWDSNAFLIPVDSNGVVLTSRNEPALSQTWEWTCQGSFDPRQLCLYRWAINKQQDYSFDDDDVPFVGGSGGSQNITVTIDKDTDINSDGVGEGKGVYYLHIQIQDDAPNANERFSEVFSFYSIVGDQNTTPLVPVDSNGVVLTSRNEPALSQTWEWTCRGSLDPGQLCLYRWAINKQQDYSFDDDVPFAKGSDGSQNITVAIDKDTDINGDGVGEGEGVYYLHIQIQDDAPNANGRVSEVFSFYSIVGDQNTPPLVPIDLESNDEWQSEKTWEWDCLWEECFVRVKILEKEDHADPDNPSYVFPEDHAYKPIEELRSETIIVQDIDENGNYIFPNSPGTYYIYLQVSDGNGNESDVISRYAKIEGTFRSKWETTSSNDTIHLPLRKGSNADGTGDQMQYDFKLNCEYDESKTDADQTLPWKDVTSWNDPDAQCTYTNAGTYTVKIIGRLDSWRTYGVANGNSSSDSLHPDRSKLIEVIDFGNMGWKNLGRAFYDCYNLTTFRGGDVSQVTDMSSMFNNASLLEELNTSSWDISSVENMRGMFFNASSLEQLDTSNWDVSSVENMNTMFYDAISLEQLDTSNWNVSSVTDMGNMFYGTSKLKQLALSNWDVSSVTDMSGMFSYASKLKQLDMSNWDFGKVTTMENIFEGASELTTESYSDMLMRIVDTSTSQDITLGEGAAKYNDCGAKARAILTTAPRNWTITDGGPEAGADAANCTASEWDPR